MTVYPCLIFFEPHWKIASGFLLSRRRDDIWNWVFSKPTLSKQRALSSSCSTGIGLVHRGTQGIYSEAHLDYRKLSNLVRSRCAERTFHPKGGAYYRVIAAEWNVWHGYRGTVVWDIKVRFNTTRQLFIAGTPRHVAKNFWETRFKVMAVTDRKLK